MSGHKTQLKYEQLGQAIERLKEAVALPDDLDIKTDGMIQRFEFTMELFWKVLKYALELQKVEAPFPKVRLQKAFAAGWIEDESIWIAMLTDRNLTSHTYNQDTAKDIALRIPGYIGEMERLYKVLGQILAEEEK